MLPTGVVELEAGWIMLGSDITLWEQHNDHYQSLHCRVTLVKYQGGVLERGEGDRRETSSTMAAWQCINHSGGTLSVSRLKTVRVNTWANRFAAAMSGEKFFARVPPRWQRVPALSFCPSLSLQHKKSQLSHFTFWFFLLGRFKTFLPISSVIFLNKYRAGQEDKTVIISYSARLNKDFLLQISSSAILNIITRRMLYLKI